MTRSAIKAEVLMHSAGDSCEVLPGVGTSSRLENGDSPGGPLEEGGGLSEAEEQQHQSHSNKRKAKDNLDDSVKGTASGNTLKSEDDLDDAEPVADSEAETERLDDGSPTKQPVAHSPRKRPRVDSASNGNGNGGPSSSSSSGNEHELENGNGINETGMSPENDHKSIPSKEDENENENESSEEKAPMSDNEKENEKENGSESKSSKPIEASEQQATAASDDNAASASASAGSASDIDRARRKGRRSARFTLKTSKSSHENSGRNTGGDAEDVEANGAGAEADEDGDVDDDADETAESQKERLEAIDLLKDIEIEFANLRDVLHSERMKRFEAEIEMCSDGTHPELAEYVAQIAQHRDHKISLAEKKREYKLTCIGRVTTGQREQVHQQFFKERSDARVKLLLETTKEWYKVNKERRAMDAMTPEYSYRVPTDEREQIHQRLSVNREVSILTGISKYIGFPSAPKMKAVDEEELQEDLEALGIPF